MKFKLDERFSVIIIIITIIIIKYSLWAAFKVGHCSCRR
jgi:hypothetical protein